MNNFKGVIVIIKIVDENIFDSKANFLLHQVDSTGIMRNGIALQVATKYPHVENEYRKYLRYCSKNNIDVLGTVQYVPVDVWALGMVNTMKNNSVIEYDTGYQYIVNLFCNDIQTYTINLPSVKMGLIDVRDKAQKIDAKIALPYNMPNKIIWNDIYDIINEVFENSGLDVVICKNNL